MVNWEVLLKVILGTIGVIAMFILPFLFVNLYFKIIEKCRRKQHPEYFKYWDAALEMSFTRGAEYSRRKDYFEHKFKLYTEGLRDGECTNQYFTEKMNKLMYEYQELCTWFKAKEEEIKEQLIKADLYAKEHNCYWGIIYDSKRT
jgi:hypothetical protein